MDAEKIKLTPFWLPLNKISASGSPLVPELPAEPDVPDVPDFAVSVVTIYE